MTLMEEDKQYIANTYGRFPFEAASGKNATCTGGDGKTYIDFSSGIGVNSLGFCDEGWAAAVAKQAATLQHISNLYYTAPMVKVAKTLCERTFADKVFFCNSGAEANEGMIKLARKYSFDKYGRGRHKIVALENSFHGRTVTTLSATGQEVFHRYFDPFTDGFSFVGAGDIAALERAADGETCGILLELIQGEGGVVPLDREFVDAAARICKERDILLMVDEVQTGIGRTGKLLCCEHYGITPSSRSPRGSAADCRSARCSSAKNAPIRSARATTPPPSAATRWPARALWRCSDASAKGCFRRSRKRARTSQGRSKGCRTS